MTTLELVQYYSNLLIFQYLGKPKAVATIQSLVSQAIMPQTTTQEIDFSAVPTSGTFVLSYNGNATASMNWNDSAATIQSDLQGVEGLGSVTVTGSIAGQSLIVTFTGVIPPALLLEIESNVLSASGVDVDISIAETDVTLPIAVQNAFNLVGDDTAVGVQLDILAKYVGVTRTGAGFNGQFITLDDTDFLTLIKMGITTNNAGSSLYQIVQIIYEFFGTSILVFDFTDMRMTYLISSSVGSQNLIELFVTEKLLPQPMGVQVAVIFAPLINSFFGFIMYEVPMQPPITRPFNDYTDYQTDWPWLTYQDAFVV